MKRNKKTCLHVLFMSVYCHSTMCSLLRKSGLCCMNFIINPWWILIVWINFEEVYIKLCMFVPVMGYLSLFTAHGRSVVGMSTDIVKHSNFNKLEKALLSGLPNEVDFAINVCTLLSSESRHSLLLRKAQTLLQLLMAHIGVFSDGKPERQTAAKFSLWQ